MSESTVAVYAFRCFDIDIGTIVVPPFKATQEAIEHRFKGEALPFTRELVDATEVDSGGRWFRIASGWGELR
jgi:hypothetical protein